MGAASDEGARLESAAGNEIERFATDCRGMVESGAKCDIAVVDSIGVEVHAGSHRTPPEEINCSTFAHHLDCFFPRVGSPNGFNSDVDPAVFRRKCAGFSDGFANGGGLDHVRRSQLLCCFYLAVVFDDGDGLASGQHRHMENHQTQGSATDDRDQVAWAWMGILKTVDRAS